MKDWIKKIFWFLVVGFALFYLVTRPEDAANAVKGFFDALGGLVRFFETLAR
ncbi:hypothetical protein [Mariniluteicoccus flavus]